MVGCAGIWNSTPCVKSSWTSLQYPSKKNKYSNVIYPVSWSVFLFVALFGDPSAASEFSVLDR